MWFRWLPPKSGSLAVGLRYSFVRSEVFVLGTKLLIMVHLDQMKGKTGKSPRGVDGGSLPKRCVVTSRLKGKSSFLKINL